MAMIKTVDPGVAKGQTEEIYDFMQQNVGLIPLPLQLVSTNPYVLYTF